MNIIITDRNGADHQLAAEDGWGIMEIVREAGLPVKAECGGCCACATCHIYVDDEWLGRIPAPNDEEADLLELAFDVQDNSRLSCQIKMSPDLDGFKASLAPDGY
ncbi:2Fe-2S iron-sulfur cluster-binding protein [Amphritea sp. HPY]|uniref:2Fe-2S iron-sulfur cluster-binding protein n=1 Tax=Amphritea sp. HPY TaxID=3421652 RepID=UPI003D7F08B0